MAGVVIDSMGDVATIIIIGMPRILSILKKLLLKKQKQKKKQKVLVLSSWLASSFN